VSTLTYRLSRGALLSVLLAVAMMTGAHWAIVVGLLVLVCAAL
jgi:hypothetical protein